MALPLLSTKFFIPRPRKALVRRERLFGLLNQGIRGKLVVASAPAGYGKTTLITSWLAEQSLPVAWFSADAGDNDFHLFFSYILGALQHIDPKVGETVLPALQTAMPPSADKLVGLLLEEISRLSGECILVMDDYHMIHDAAIHAAVRQIIEGSPRHLHFILCSRIELPFPLSKLRSHDDLLELSQRELSLTLGESADYMNLVMGAGLSPEDIAILHERTEGWLAGMQLAAISLRGQADPGGFIRSLKGDNRYIGDYLVDEVLMLTPPELQDFLLRTSILGRMDAALCNYVLQIEHSRELLEAVDKQRLFIIPLDDKRDWFRYHHLFREMLFARLQQKSPRLLAGLYQRASAWHGVYEMDEDAIDYALAGSDYERAGNLLKKIGMQFLFHGRWSKLLSWYERIPEDYFLRRCDLWLPYFSTLINAGLIVEAAHRIEQISLEKIRSLGLPEPECNCVRGELAAVQGVVFLHSKADPGRARESLAIARECLANDQTFRRAFANNNYAVSCLLLGEVEEARQVFERNVAYGRMSRSSLAVVMGTSYLAEATAMSGDLPSAHELLQDVVRYVHETGLQHGAVFAKANLGLGSLYYEWNRLDDALRYLTEGMRLAEQGGYLDQLLLGAAVLARIQNTRGDLRGLQETIKRTRRMAEKYGEPPQAVSFIKALEADMAQQQDDRLLLDHWLTHQARGGATPANLFAQYERMTLARVLAAKKDYTGVSDVIKPVWEHALRQGRLKTVITCEAMMARCLFMQGQPLPAVSILQGALFKAEPNRFVRSFLDEGGVMISMIKQLLSARGEKKPGPEECSTEYLYLLLDEVARDTMQASTSRPVPKSEDGLEPLTPQEMHILDMLEAGYPNKQIAQELNISLNTVKYHLKNIYGKMGVVNRTQAARILRKEGA